MSYNYSTRNLVFAYAILFQLLVSSLLLAQHAYQSPVEQYLTDQQLHAQKTPEGLFYHIDEAGNQTRRPGAGHYVMVQYTASLLGGEVFDQTDQSEPFTFQVGYRQVIKGIDIGIRLIGEGGKIRLYVPPSLGYQKVGAGDDVPPDAALYYEVTLQKILTEEEYDDWMLEVENREKEQYSTFKNLQTERDLELINQFCTQRKLKPSTTASGLQYLITKKGKGKMIAIGTQVELSFEGWLADGTQFDSTKRRGGNLHINFGIDKLSDGWQEGLPLFSEGSEGWLILPSRLAYGNEAINEFGIQIPANSPLFFKLKVEKCK